MTENKNTSDSLVNEAQQLTNIGQQEIPQNTKRRFEVEIYDQVLNEKTNQLRFEKVRYDNPVIIEASSKKDLQDFAERLKLCQQIFKIVRVLDDSPNKPVPKPTQVQQPQQVSEKSPVHIPIGYIPQLTPLKPKYYKVGDVEIKDDNGKIYQKQWIKLSDEELLNFRLINSKTNAIISLKDRSIEMKKWVLIENTEDTTADLEGNIK